MSWFRDELGGRADFAQLSAEAAEIPPGAAGLITLPYFSGERTPINDPHACGLFFGLTLSHTRAHIYRSCLEGIAFGLRHNIEAMASAGATPRRLIAIGGGAQDALWPQICSDVSGLPQDLPARTIGAAYGDAYIAGMAAGVFDDFAPLHETWVTIERRIEPNPAHTGVYNALYPVYRDLYRDTHRHMARLAEVEN